MIKVENMSFKWTDKLIFENVGFNVNDGEKVDVYLV